MRVRNGAVYQRLAREIVESNPVCAVCHEPISLEITRLARHRFMADGVTRNPWYMHRDGGTAGHIISVYQLRLMGQLHRANDRTNLRPEHRRCNSSAGGRIGAQLTNARKRGRPDPTIRTPSQDW